MAGQDWLSVPVRTKGIKRQLIREVRVKNDAYDWRRKHFKSLQVNYTYAGYFEALEELLRPFFDQAYDNLGAVNLASIKLVRRYLDIRTPMQLTSQLPLQGRGAALLAEMTVLLGCDTFLADSRYREYLSAEVFRQAGVGLQFWDFEARPYHQQFGDFVPGFSVLDLLFNEGREAIQVISGNR